MSGSTNSLSQTEWIYKEDIFWLRILGDHAFFQFIALEETEVRLKQQAKQYKEQFDIFLTQALQSESTATIPKFHESVYKWVLSFKKFKLYLLEQMLNRTIKINLVPTFINHMVNELEEYENILIAYINKKRPPVKTTIDEHLLWLLDASGHSSAIASSLDDTEHQLHQEAMKFKRTFHKLYLKAVEFKGFLRTKDGFPAIQTLDEEGSHEISIFSNFMRKLQNLLRHNLALADISIYLLDHMLREECYYLQKVQQLNPALNLTSCDFTREREIK